jgi:PAS domain S-box-containing protein
MQGFVREMSLDLRCANGSLLPVLANAKQHRNPAGETLVTRTTIFDATERRTYERELQRARRRALQLASVVETSADAIIIASADGTAQTWNAGAEHLFGYSAREAIGVPMRQLIVPEDRAEEFERVLTTVRSGQQVQLETVRLRQDGTRVEVSLSLTPHMEPPGELTAISAIIRDITERRRVESRLRRAEQLQSAATLAGGVAHEVNNQMAVVLGFGEFVLRALGKEHPQRSDVEAMVEAGAKVARITRQLLAFSRQLPMSGQDIQLTPFIRQLVPRLAKLLGGDKHLEIAHLEADVTIHADPIEIEQILVQLTSNARDAMSGGGRLELATENVSLAAGGAPGSQGDEVTAGEYAMISLCDTGSGIEPEMLDRIFEPFFTTKPVGQGSGLGLAVVHGIVKQHGGHIWIISERERGTTVRVYLPAAGLSARLADGSAGAMPTHESAGAAALLAPEFH